MSIFSLKTHFATADGTEPATMADSPDAPSLIKEDNGFSGLINCRCNIGALIDFGGADIGAAVGLDAVETDVSGGVNGSNI